MKCTICSSEEYKVVADKNNMRWNCWNYDKHIVKCNNCGLVYLTPRWEKEELKKLYKGYNYQEDFKGQKQAPRITKYLSKYLNIKDRILEIGCGRGEDLYRLRKEGYNIVGIDKDKLVCDNTFIFNRDILEDNFHFPFSIDFVYAIQVFEHISNPREFLVSMIKILKGKPNFLLEIPNNEDPLLSIYKISQFKKFYNIPHHMFFYTPKTIKLLFKRYNIPIKIILYQKYGILNHLRWLILRRPGNWHPHIPILDTCYKWILERIIKKTDTMLILGDKI